MDKTHALQWEVPLNYFYVDRTLYRPKPTLWSPITEIETDRLQLKWQVSLEQGQSSNRDAEVFVHHQTPYVPNQGVSYTVFAIRQSGQSTELTDKLRRSLNLYAESRYKQDEEGEVGEDGWQWTDGIHGQKPPTSKGSRFFRTVKSSFARNRLSMAAQRPPKKPAATVEELIWPGDMIKLRIILGLNNDVWNPTAILQTKIAAWYVTDQQTNHQTGMLEKQLWAEVLQITPAAPIPKCADLVFVCPKGERIVAHKPVVAGCSRFIADLIQTARTGDHLTLGLTDTNPAVLLEMLHFMYNRQVSPKFHRQPPAELLRAAHSFELPEVVLWEVEKVLTRQLDHENLNEMSALANCYDLKVLRNMTKKMSRDAGELVEMKQRSMVIAQENTFGFCMEV